MEYKLSNQAIGALMLALQKGLMEKCDITELLQGFKLVNSEEGLMVENPPVLHMEQVESDQEIA